MVELLWTQFRTCRNRYRVLYLLLTNVKILLKNSDRKSNLGLIIKLIIDVYHIQKARFACVSLLVILCIILFPAAIVISELVLTSPFFLWTYLDISKMPCSSLPNKKDRQCYSGTNSIKSISVSSNSKIPFAEAQVF